MVFDSMKVTWGGLLSVGFLWIALNALKSCEVAVLFYMVRGQLLARSISLQAVEWLSLVALTVVELQMLAAVLALVALAIQLWTYLS